YQGADLTRMSASARAQAGIARSFQISAIFPTLSVLEHARLAAQARGRGRYQLLRPYTAYPRYLEQGSWGLDLVGLAMMAARPAGALSHGDKRKLELAMVLAGDPDLLLLDEPTSGLSAEDVPAMAALIQRVREGTGKTVIMIEHKIGMVLDLSDRVAVLAQGKLLAIDTPAKIQRSDAVQAAYLGRESA
ncbi:MAG: ABC transporter ATP-binding protein, partial [Chloroflexota bacterium]